MKDFLKSVFASTLGTFLAIFVGGMLAVLLIVALASSAGGNLETVPVSVKPKTMLVIGGGLTINDTPAHGTPGFDALLFGGGGPELDLLRALEAIDLAAKDQNIAGILLTGPLGAGLAQMAEIRKAITAFKGSGKPVIAWLENGGQGEYYLSSVADKVYVHGAGGLQFSGLSSYNLYFGETFKLLGIGVQVTKVGKYKSAVEPYLSDVMSETDREQSEALLGGVWKRILGDVSQSRGLTTASLAKTVSSAGVYGARTAVGSKLADKAMHRDELVKLVRAAGAAADESGTSFLQVNLHRYASKVKLPTNGPKIAIVYAEGEIVDGWGMPGLIGGDQLARDLRLVRADEDIKAVVLRVNSPGGSAFASDVVAREVGLLKSQGIPVVVSMGDVAASGGYYIAAPANLIMADPSTITGSIGVFGLHFNYGELAKKVKLGTDGVKTAPFADLLEGHRPATAEEMAIVQSSVDDVYEDFLRIVAAGRGMKRDEVHEMAQGRVWLGEDARGLRLVDKLGGLRDAITEAKLLAKTEEAELIQIPALNSGKETLLEMLLADEQDSPLFAKASRDPAKELLKANAKWLCAIRALNDPKGVYLTCPIVPARR